MGVKPTRWYSNKQEKSVAKTLNGHKVANSGATQYNKGDVTTNLFLIECKTSMSLKKSFSIKYDWLRKNQEESFAMGKPYSALAFDFGDGVNHYVISESLFKLLKQYLESEECE